MADITMCTAKNCKIKDTCYRFTAKADRLYQSYANFNNDKEVKDKKDCSDYQKGRKEGEGKNDRRIKE